MISSRIFARRRDGQMSLHRLFVTDQIQAGLHIANSVSGLPWWATICCSTFALRASLLPMVRNQLISSRKLGNAMPEVNFLFQLLRNRLRVIPAANTTERRKVISVFFKGVKACFTLHEVHILELVLYPMINIGVFIGFVYSVRDLLIHGSGELGLDQGGGLWFKDLTEKDKTFYLPFTAISLSYLALEIALANSNGKLLVLLKDIGQCLLLLSVPFSSTLPSGVFCYWIPSSIFGIVQSVALKSPKIQKLLKLPALPTVKR